MGVDCDVLDCDCDCDCDCLGFCAGVDVVGAWKVEVVPSVSLVSAPAPAVRVLAPACRPSRAVVLAASAASVASNVELSGCLWRLASPTPNPIPGARAWRMPCLRDLSRVSMGANGLLNECDGCGCWPRWVERNVRS